MVTLIVVDSLFFSDRYLDRAFFLKTRTSIFFCAAINFVRGAKIAQRQLWQNTTRGIIMPRDFSEEKWTEINILW